MPETNHPGRVGEMSRVSAGALVDRAMCGWDQCQVEALLPVTLCQVEAAVTLYQVEAAWSELAAENVARTTTSMRAMAAKSAITEREVVRTAVMAWLLDLGC
jgi:hypothetical protein